MTRRVCGAVALLVDGAEEAFEAGRVEAALEAGRVEAALEAGRVEAALEAGLLGAGRVAATGGTLSGAIETACELPDCPTLTCFDAEGWLEPQPTLSSTAAPAARVMRVRIDERPFCLV